MKVYATGTTSAPVIDADVSVATGKKYTIAATNAVASIEAQVLEDTPSPSCDTAQVRVVRFSADAPAVDVAAAGAAPADAVVKNLAYPNATDYLALPGGTYDLEVRLAGTTTVALALPDVAIENCTSYSVFAIGSAAGSPVGGNALQVVAAADGSGRSRGGCDPTRNGLDDVRLRLSVRVDRSGDGHRRCRSGRRVRRLRLSLAPRPTELGLPHGNPADTTRAGRKTGSRLAVFAPGLSQTRIPHVAAGLADDADEVLQVGERPDVRRGAVDRPDRDPGDRAAHADAGRDHLDLELEAALGARRASPP